MRSLPQRPPAPAGAFCLVSIAAGSQVQAPIGQVSTARLHELLSEPLGEDARQAIEDEIDRRARAARERIKDYFNL